MFTIESTKGNLESLLVYVNLNGAEPLMEVDSRAAVSVIIAKIRTNLVRTQLYHIRVTYKWPDIVEKHENHFKDELGLVKGIEFTLIFHDQVQPQFYRPLPVRKRKSQTRAE